MVVSSHLDAGNQAQVLCKSSKYSKPLHHLLICVFELYQCALGRLAVGKCLVLEKGNGAAHSLH